MKTLGTVSNSGTNPASESAFAVTPREPGTLELELRNLRAENAQLRAALALLRPLPESDAHGGTTPPLAPSDLQPIGTPVSSDRSSLFEHVEAILPLGAWTLDLATKRMMWSQGFYRLMDLDHEQHTPSIERFYSAIHPEERERFLSRLRVLGEQGDHSQAECRLARRDGSWRSVRVHNTLLRDEQGQPWRSVGMAIDLSEIRERERELERANEELLQAQRIAQVGSFRWDMQEAVYMWSDELCRIFGESASFRPTTRLFYERIHRDDRSRVKAVIARAIATGQVAPVEFRVVTRAGIVRDVYMDARAKFDASGDVIGFSGTVLDLTERKRLEAQLAQSQKLEALGRLAGGVAHDFNNLLTAILANSELIGRREIANSSDGMASEEVQDITRAAEHAAALTRDLMAFCRRSSIRTQIFSLNQAITRATSMIRRVIGDAIEVTLDLHDDLWAIHADEQQVIQILMNLGINARDAMPGGGNLRIATSNAIDARTGEEVVCLTVSDTGQGMSQEVASRAFEPFFTTKDTGKGTGLGLAMVYGFVTQHAGTIEVNSKVDKGTTFELRWPRALPAFDPSLAVTDPAARERAAWRPTIFVVDVNDVTRRTVVRLLQQAGYQVLHAGQLSFAQQWLQAGMSFDILLTDLDDFARSGLQAVTTLTRQLPRLVVICMTSSTRHTGASTSALLSPKEATIRPSALEDLPTSDKPWIIPKPISMGDLLEMMARASRLLQAHSQPNAAKVLPTEFPPLR